ncbi:MAG: hypothetical protein AB7E32_10915 [Desulfovibrio sp.]
MLFDVPFLPDTGYLDFLAGRATSLESMHFSLYNDLLADARPALERRDALEVTELLSRVIGPDKYLLLNAAFHGEAQYHNRNYLRSVAGLLRLLMEGAELRGLIWVDAYLLRALHDAAPSLCTHLEAVPGVNRGLDHEDKVTALLGYAQECGFRPPARVILDRSLNRRPTELRRVCRALRLRHPALRIGLLANEGCLPHCAHKPAHDALIALGHLRGHEERTYVLNRDFGCIRSVLERPERLFSSPFLRPEDLEQVADCVDLIKICGRNNGGAAFLQRAVSAYLSGRYQGNLLDLLDTLGAFADRFDVPNAELPSDFYQRMADCGGRCALPGHDCDRCALLFREHVRTLAPVLRPMPSGTAS